jgi:hypothetical protein
MSKPDIVFHYSDSLIVVVEADDDDVHSVSRGPSISEWASPWRYLRDLNAEMAKMKTVCSGLTYIISQEHTSCTL